jgi:hypothetical protein
VLTHFHCDNQNVIVRRHRNIAVLFLLLSCLAYSAEPKEKQATGAKVAADWLALLDNGKFGEAWKQLSPSQRPNASKDKWQSDVSRYRRQVGKLHDRKLLSAEYTTKVPGAEEGEYVVVTFLSSFERLGSALEIVVPQLSSDGSWVISGYSIKPADATE